MAAPRTPYMGEVELSNSTSLQREWPAVLESASKAETAVHTDSRTACFYARRTLELAVAWAFKHDPWTCGNKHLTGIGTNSYLTGHNKNRSY